LAASLVFYAWFKVSFLAILLFACGIDYFAAQGIFKSKSPTARRLLLTLSMSINLGFLGLFKYHNFFVENWNSLLSNVGVRSGMMPFWQLALPIGISFYTFESMSYTIDVYRGKIPVVRNFWKFLLFISFFPHLIAGPIVRARDFLHQIDRKRSWNLQVFSAGLYLLVRGFFLKMVVADNLGAIVDKLWTEISTKGTSASLTLLVVILFSFQILCDFEGYSTIARGAAYILGFHLPINFNKPYLARSFKNFWERWHITLSQWLRDYLYIPLGGNKGSSWKTYRNLLTVMLLGGLWHGASFTFLVWGGIHGSALAIERFFGLNRIEKSSSILFRFGWYLVVQAMVIVAWIFFRSPDFSVARGILSNLFAGGFRRIDDISVLRTCLICLFPVLVGHVRVFLQEKSILKSPGWAELCAQSAVMFAMIVTCYGKVGKFIYFQF
jgi:D-alanyl-lipoteichoic acid acyltransferase DltB (MBOAT superfamily)